jgi:hypothetical protein
MSAPGPGEDAVKPPAGEPASASEPPALGDLAATDALLDRLGTGSPVTDDLDDPAVVVLAELLSVVDDPAEVDGDVGRLMEVLGDRPLYLVGTDEAAGETPPEEVPISLGPPDPRVIDLTAQKSDAAPEPAAGAEPSPSSVVILPTSVKAQQRWGRGLSVIQHASLPAASVLILLVLGGGVSAVVTGDPMAPVNGVTRVVSALPGVDRPAKPSVNQVERELSAAAQAMRSNDKEAAAHHLAAARQGLAELPSDQQARLTAVADQVQTSIETGVPPIGLPGVPADPGNGTSNGTTTTTPPVVVAPATTPADPAVTDSPSNPPVTDPPVTTDPVPPTTPPTSDPTPTDSPSTDASVESTPAPS